MAAARQREIRGDPSPLERHAKEAPLSRLVLELVLAQAESDEVVAAVHVDLRRVTVTRGGAELDPASFRLSDHLTQEMIQEMGLLGPLW